MTSGIFESPDRSDVNSTINQSGTVSVSTSEVEIKVGGTREARRQLVLISHGSNTTLYVGPTGVTTSTGIPVFKDQIVSLPVGDTAIYAISSGGTHTLRVWELG